MNTEQQVEEQQQPLKEEQTITKNPPPRIKNPKRVAQGKKLALISKEAKQRKKEKLETERTKQEKESQTTTSMIVMSGTILGTCCTLLLTYIAYTQWMKEKKEDQKTIKKSSVHKDLSKYDL